MSHPNLVDGVTAEDVSTCTFELDDPLSEQLEVVSEQEDLTGVGVFDERVPEERRDPEKDAFVHARYRIIYDNDRRVAAQNSFADARKKVQERNGSPFSLAQVGSGQARPFYPILLAIVARGEGEL
jgi:hypothetical protein